MNPTDRTLRFGIICDSDVLEVWQARCLSRLLTVPGVELGLIIRKAEAPVLSSAAPKLTRFLPLRNLLWRLYVRLYVSRRSRAMEPVAMSEVLPEVPVLVCEEVKRGKFKVGLSEQDIATVRDHNLDFLLLINFGILGGDILRAARHGVWSFHHDDPERHRGLPPCFWEIFHGDLVSGAILQRLTERLDGGIILQRGFVKTVGYSYARNVDAVYFMSVDWPAKVCADLLHGVAGYLDAAPTRTTAPVRYLPTNGETLQFLAIQARGLGTRLFRALCRNEQWTVGVADAPIEAFLEHGARPAVRWLPEPGAARFLADPFGIAEGEKLTLLAEEYDYRDGRGFIGTARVGPGERSRAVPAMQEPIHMSYPYLLEHDGEIYCIPETAEARQVVLFRAVEFPQRWERAAVLIDDFAGVDSTVFEHEGRWWLLCTDGDRDVDSALCAWHAVDLSGPWEPHVSNPIKIDVRCSRPAGTPFVHGGQLYRPAQDSSRVYAGAVVIHRVTRLTPTEFSEEEVSRVEPYGESLYPDGLHTLAGVGERTLIDGKREVFMLPAVMSKVMRLVRALRGRV